MKSILKPFMFVINLLLQAIKFVLLFMLFITLGCLILYYTYQAIMWYAGNGLDLVLSVADIYIKIADEGMATAIKLGNDLNWYMYGALKLFVLFCVLFYSIPLIMIVVIIFSIEPVYNVRVVK